MAVDGCGVLQLVSLRDAKQLGNRLEHVTLKFRAGVIMSF